MKVRILLGLLTGLLSLIFMAAFGYLGYNFGQEIGFSTAYQASFDIGYQDAINQNFEEGYDEGFLIGIEDGKENAISSLDEAIIEAAKIESYDIGREAGIEIGVQDGIKDGYESIIKDYIDFNKAQIQTYLKEIGYSCSSSRCAYVYGTTSQSETAIFDFTNYRLYAYVEYLSDSTNEEFKQRVGYNLLNSTIEAEWIPRTSTFGNPNSIRKASSNDYILIPSFLDEREHNEFIDNWIDQFDQIFIDLNLDWLRYLEIN
jgi:hypothetical protein